MHCEKHDEKAVVFVVDIKMHLRSGNELCQNVKCFIVEGHRVKAHQGLSRSSRIEAEDWVRIKYKVRRSTQLMRNC